MTGKSITSPKGDDAMTKKSVSEVPAEWQTMKAQPMLVTPEKATEWLKTVHTNRRLSEPRIMSMATDMVRGYWRANPQPLIVNCDGTLIDGYHRASACVLADRPFWAMVVVGAPRKVAEVIDLGRARRPSDALRMFHGMDNAERITALVRGIHKITYTVGNSATLGVDQILDGYKRYQDGIDWVVAKFTKNRIGAVPVAAALAFAYPTAPERIDEFASELKDGGPDISTGAQMLRRMVYEDGKHRVDTRNLSLRTLRYAQAYIAGEEIKLVRNPETALEYFKAAYPPEQQAFYYGRTDQGASLVYDRVRPFVKASGRPRA